MNPDTLQRRIRWITVAVLVGTAVLFTILDSTGNMDAALSFLRDPIATVMGWANARSESVTAVLEGPRTLQEAESLIGQQAQRIDELERELERLSEVERQFQNMTDLLNRAQIRPEFTRVTANVIGYDTSPAVRSIIIDKGSADGVNIGMAVESARGVVGQVFRTTQNTAQVALITDNASAIPVRLSDSRATGIMHGGGLGGETRIEWIDLQYELHVGELVVTSGLAGGLSNHFPAGLPVGRVITIDRNEAELFQTAVVQPAVDFEALEVLFVITNFNPVDTSIFESPTEN